MRAGALSLFFTMEFPHRSLRRFFFFFNDTATTEIYTSLHTLSLHDALPIRNDAELDEQPEGVPRAPLLDDLPACEARDRHARHGHVLPGRRNPGDLARVRPAGRPAGRDLVPIGELVFHDEPHAFERRPVPLDELLEAVWPPCRLLL